MKGGGKLLTGTPSWLPKLGKTVLLARWVTMRSVRLEMMSSCEKGRERVVEGDYISKLVKLLFVCTVCCLCV